MTKMHFGKKIKHTIVNVLCVMSLEPILMPQVHSNLNA